MHFVIKISKTGKKARNNKKQPVSSAGNLEQAQSPFVLGLFLFCPDWLKAKCAVYFDCLQQSPSSAMKKQLTVN